MEEAVIQQSCRQLKYNIRNNTCQLDVIFIAYLGSQLYRFGNAVLEVTLYLAMEFSVNPVDYYLT